MTIRQVRPDDAGQITELYNWYIVNGVESFETEPLPVSEMLSRIEHISASYPYYVAEVDGKVAGYCYAHLWKERAAYSNTLETTIYLNPEFKRHGAGTALMDRLIADCRRMGVKALIACITGDDEVIGAEQTLQLRRDRAGREDHAAHHIPLLCQSLTSLTSSYMAQ